MVRSTTHSSPGAAPSGRELSPTVAHPPARAVDGAVSAAASATAATSMYRVMPPIRPSATGGSGEASNYLAMYDHLRYEQDGPVTLITIDRPERMNAIGPQTHRELVDAWERFRDDDEAHVAVLTGRGRQGLLRRRRPQGGVGRRAGGGDRSRRARRPQARRAPGRARPVALDRPLQADDRRRQRRRLRRRARVGLLDRPRDRRPSTRPSASPAGAGTSASPTAARSGCRASSACAARWS